MKIVTCLFLLTFVNVSTSSEPTDDPTGWGSFLTEHRNSIDAVDVVDPSGWNYDRGAKSSIRNGQDIDNNRAQQVLMFCEKVLEKRNLETNLMIEDEINTAIKAKIAETFSREEAANENLAFVRRFVSILLNTADLPNLYVEDGPEVSGVIEIKMTSEHLKTLIHFSKSDANVSMRELDSILSASLHRKYIPTFSTSELIEKIFFMVRQKEIWLPIVLVFVMLCVFRLIVYSKTKTYFLTSFLLLIFVASYVVEYYKLYKDAEIKQKMILDKHSEIPPSCDPRYQPWWISLFKSFGFNNNEKECIGYHKAVLLDPLLEVSPSRVLCNILTDFVLTPFNKVGETIAIFSSTILDGLPFYYGWIVWVGSSIAIFVLITMVLVILIGGSIQFRWFFSGVNISRPQAPQETLPPAAPAVSAAPVHKSVSQPLLEAVSGMSNFVLMDANSLGTIMLRAQSSVSTLHSGVQELNSSSRDALSLSPPKEKVDLSKLQKERILQVTEKDEITKSGCEISDKILKFDGEGTSLLAERNSELGPPDKYVVNKELLSCEDTGAVTEEDCELESPDNEKVKEELLGSFEIIQSDVSSSLLEATKIKKLTNKCKSNITSDNIGKQPSQRPET